MLFLPADPGLWSEVISRWESITINRLNNQTLSDNKAKLASVENLLGESEKLMWQQWRTMYPEAYAALEAIANEPQNITSQVRQLILLEDPYHGSTDEQDRAYKDLDRITCEETKNLWSFLEDFRQLAIKSGRLYFPSTTEKLFAKLPSSLSKKIKEPFKAKYPGLNSGVLPAIKFTHTFVSEMCKDVALAKELRDLSLCSTIPIPGYYKNNRKKYGIRKSRTYKGKPHNSHVKPFKIKYKDDKGRHIRGRSDTHQNISVMVQDAPFEEAAFMLEEEINEGDSKDENEYYLYSHHAFMFHPGPPTKIAEMVQSIGSWKQSKELLAKSKKYMSRLNCPKCQLTTCALCARNYLGKIVNVKGKQPQKPEEEKDFSSNEVKILKEFLKEKTEQVQQMIRDQAKEYYENKTAIQKKEELWQSKESLLIKDLTDDVKIIEQLKA
ncbi:hypothetical protein Tco_0895449 [Tanacetum coccineum]|uniref:Uncharacterized protein n=1 Tax=Tanacetum coccineum TaxID=301880 RepID=A0ABQ5CGV7_9ASTR